MEDRIVPTQWIWTNGTSSGLANNAANWTDATNGSNHGVPTSSDYIIFGGFGGSNTNCTFNISLSVDRVVMNSDYASTLTISAGSTLALNNHLQQYGTLVMESGAAIVAGTNIYLNGTLTKTGIYGGTATIDASGSFFLIDTGAIVVTGLNYTGPDLSITSGGFDHAGSITVGTSMGGQGTLTIDGEYAQIPDAATTIYGAGTLHFTTGGSDIPSLAGDTTLYGDITTETALYLQGGTMTVYGYGASINGDFAVFNGGELNLSASSTLTLLAGDFTVGSSAPNIAANGGTVNLALGSILAIPTAGAASTFVITSQGVVNMYGADIVMAPSRVAYLEIMPVDDDLPAGLLYTGGGVFSSTVVGDAIVGNVVNNGVVEFGGDNLHALAIDLVFGVGGGDYTQGEEGTLKMRLDNAAKEDELMVADDAVLDGPLELSGLDDLDDAQEWTIIMAPGGRVGNFAAFTWPDADPDWLGVPGAFSYKVVNS